MSTTVLDLQKLNEMPLAELRALQIQHDSGVVPDPVIAEPAAQPAVPAVTETPAATEITEPGKKRFRRIIDIGDGAGKQEFSGDTLDELVENLAKAQENATRKIREQAAQLKANENSAATPKPPTAEERLAALEARIAWQNTAAEFIGKHPDYENTQANATKIERYMAIQGLPRTLEGLEQAFNELSESGLLPGKNATTATEQTTAGIPPAATTTAQPASSGLSARAGSLAQRAAKEELTVQDVSKLDDATLRQKTKEWLLS